MLSARVDKAFLRGGYFYFNVSLLEVDVEADQDETDVDEQGKQAADDKEHLCANYLMLIMESMTQVLRDIKMTIMIIYTDRSVSVSVSTFLKKSLKMY